MSSAGSTASSRSRRLLPSGIEWLPAIVIAASLLPRIALWFRRDYNHDDFAFGYGTWNYGRGGEGYGYGFVFLLTEIMKPLFRIFPESFLPLDIARVLVLLAYLANLALVHRICRLLGASKLWALCAVAVAAWQPDLVMRAEDVRTDPFGTTCILGGALLVLKSDARYRFERAGFLFGLAVILDYKYGVAAPFAAAAVVMIAWPRVWRPLLRLVLGSLVPLVPYLGRLVWLQTWKGFLFGLEQTALSLEIGSQGKAGVRTRAVFHPSPVIFVLVGVGAVGFLAAFLQKRTGVRPAVYTILVIAFFATFLRLNPFFFPYNFDLFTPLLTTLIPGIPLLAESLRWNPRAEALTAVFVCLAAAAEGVPAFAKVLTRTNAAQKRVVEWIWKSTAPDEHVFDWQGIHLFRPGIFHWWLFTGLVPKYQTGDWYSIADELKRYRVTLVISTYRLAWLNAADKAYVDSHFVGIDTCLLAPGHVFRGADFAGGVVTFEPTVDGDYRMDHPAPGLTVDGARVDRVFRLSRGAHLFAFSPDATPPPVFAIVYSTPLRDRHAAERPCPVNEPLLFGFD